MLLVESDVVDEARIVRAFQESGHRNRLIVARTAENALTLLRACVRGLRFGLVLVDMHIPRFGARNLLQGIRRDPDIHDTPVVVFAPEDAPIASIEHEAALADSWVRRPGGYSELTALIRKILDFFLRRHNASPKS